MTVRSMKQVLDDFACVHLNQTVPEDVDCVHDIASILMPDICAEGHLHGYKSVVKVNLWTKFPDGPGGEQSPAVHLSATMPAYHVYDGDTAPLEHVLDEMWTDTVFMTTANSALPEMYQALCEIAPDQIEDDPDFDGDDEEDDEDDQGDLISGEG